jgi:2,5-diketo-D-gluconate reductase B
MGQLTREEGVLTVQGIEIPRLGLGTWQLRGRAAADSVWDALEIGYRHIDTARA